MFAIKRVQSAIYSFALKSRKINLQAILFNKAKDRDFIQVEIKGETLKFPILWLRDNCQCEKCFHHSAKSRILNWSNFDFNVTPKNVVKDENSLQVTWNDGHVSKYILNWLKFRSFNKKDQLKYKEIIYKPSKITWRGEDFSNICSKHDYTEILESNIALFQWLEKLAIYGVALIKNAPNSETALDDIVAKIGFTKRTHYGVKFVVQHIANTSNVAYLSNNLQMHTDLPYYEYCPGVNMLHCLVQTKSNGGANLLSDCYYVANFMRQNHPIQYKLLTDIDVEWSDIGTEDGNEFYKLYRSPVICLNKYNEITRINFSIPQRGSIFLESIDNVKPWYEAHRLFLMLNHRFAANFKTQAGDILVFDNIRLLHGRNAYEDNTDNVRKLIGAYVDWDEVYSRLRCLKVKLENIEGI